MEPEMMSPLDDVLLDVRRSYRLLADYQQRLFELLGYIRERLGAVASYQEPVFKPPRDMAGLESDDFSGWRYLPCFDLSVIWLKNAGQESPKDNHRAGDQMFGVWIRSDTGFDKYNKKFSSEAVEQTRSELVLSVVVCDSPAAAPYDWYSNVWCGIPYPADGAVGASDDVPGYRCYVKAVPLALLADQSSVNASIDTWCMDASYALGVPVGP